MDPFRLLLLTFIISFDGASFADLPKLSAFPMQVDSCNHSFVLTRPPQRAVSIDINNTEMMLTLGLADHMVGVAGISNKHDILAELQIELAKVKTISAKYPSLEAILGANPDFVLAGWQYGFSETSGITPRRLAKLKVHSYAIRESCIRVTTSPAITMEDPFQDLLTIGRIFQVEDRANELIAQFRHSLATLPKIAPHQVRPRVFLYDSGEQTPFTAGGFAIPTAMIEAAGGTNIFSDVSSSWIHVNWEDVIERRPELIIIVDYDQPSAADKWQMLKRKLGKLGIPAIDNDHYMVLPYASATPGIRNVQATKKISQTIQKLLSARQQL